ncbi:MAG: hypothetical protein ACTSXX_12420 [Candidatus Baldrarchaeia archaeon]
MRRESIITGRNNVVNKAKEMINQLRSNIYDLMKSCEHETLFNFVFMFPNIFAALSKNREAKHRLYVDIAWFRSVIAVTTALNYILPDFVPLKPPSRLDRNKLKKAFKVLPCITFKLSNLAWWLFIVENKYVDKVIVEDSNPEIYWSEEYRDALHKYVITLFNNEDHLDWLEWFYSRLATHKELINALDSYLLKKYGFYLNDLANASEYLMNLYNEFKRKNEPPIIHKNKLHEVFSKNIRCARSSKLLHALIFDRNKDLLRSPLIPLKNGDLLIAGWVFDLHLHFDAWIRHIMEEEPRLRDIYMLMLLAKNLKITL